VSRSGAWRLAAYDILGTVVVSGAGIAIGPTTARAPPKLRIPSGSTLRFASDAALVAGPRNSLPGTLTIGSQFRPSDFSNPTVLTSWRDRPNARDGDPAPGDWGGVVLDIGAIGKVPADSYPVDNSHFSSAFLGVEIRFAGAMNAVDACTFSDGDYTHVNFGAVRMAADLPGVSFKGNRYRIV